jgi:polyvinyl alcohol dehydrogenase (cytochrome)
MTNKLWIGFGGIAAAVVGTLVVGLPVTSRAQPPAGPGQTIFESRCRMCHEPAIDRAPGREQLGYMMQLQIVDALTNGVMQPMATGLSDADKRAVAEFLAPGGGQVVRNSGAAAPVAPAAGGRPPQPGPVVTVDTVCTTTPPVGPGKSDWIGAGNGLTAPRYQPNPGIKTSDVPKLKLKWAMSVSQGNGQPTVMGDWMWVSGSGHIYGMDPKTGCVHWRADNITSRTTPMPIKSTISPSGWALIVSQRNKVVKALDAATGKEIWASEVLDTHRASGLTGSPIVFGNQVFAPISSGEEASSGAPNYACCSFRGSVVALDLMTGKKQWQTFPIQEPMKPIRKTAAGSMLQGPAGAAIWSQPSVDAKRGVIYVATGDSYTEAHSNGTDAIMAINMKDGSIKWTTQVTETDNFIMNCTIAKPGPNCPTPLGPDYDFGSTPILATLPNGKQVLLSGQKSGITYGMDPDTGKEIWKTQVGAGGSLGGVEWGIASDGKTLYAGSSDIVTLFDEYLRPQGKQSLFEEPEPSNPGLTAVDAATGKIVWHVKTPNDECTYHPTNYPTHCFAGNSAAPAAMPGIVFDGSTDGWFRAYDAKTGQIVWKFNTTGQKYDTINGVKGQPGGGIDGNGPTIANGMVFVQSGFQGAAGYGGTGTSSMVLLAFSVDGK